MWINMVVKNFRGALKPIVYPEIGLQVDIPKVRSFNSKVDRHNFDFSYDTGEFLPSVLLPMKPLFPSHTTNHSRMHVHV